MNLNDFIVVVKRECRYGDPGATTDQATADILAEVNIRRKRIWRKFDWAWAMEELSFSLTTSTNRYAVTALADPTKVVDRLSTLYPIDTSVTPNVKGEPLVQLPLHEYYRWCASGTQMPDFPSRYVNFGRNSAGLWTIEVWPTPARAMTMGGWAKKILTTMTAADVAANTSFDYFPDGVVEDVLLDGVKSGIFHVQGADAEAARLDLAFEAKLKLLVSEQAPAGLDNSPPTSPVPDHYRAKKRQRAQRGTWVG